MKKYSSLIWSYQLFFLPLISSSVLVTTPSQAVTFARSEGEFNLTNISEKPLGTRTITDTNTITIAKDGVVNAFAQAQATFQTHPAQASNLSLSKALGKGRDYLGNAQSQAVVIANFAVDANKSFSFDFTSNFNLQTSVDNPPTENARATGEEYFTLIDTDNNSSLDFFNIRGNLNTLTDDDFIASQNSNNVTLNKLLSTSNFGGLQQQATANVQGSLQRFFANKTNIALVEVKRNQATVQAPESTTNLALLWFCSVISFATWAKRKVSS
ncbi:MAG: hypothetical protein PUP92_35145 [Rhizonema sp. PD38]|nr:hypothetical protein [Rhizonema sp. PD38]